MNEINLKNSMIEYKNSYPANARVEKYKSQAEQRLLDLGLPLQWSELLEEQIESLDFTTESLYKILLYSKKALHAIGVGDFDLFGQSLDRIIKAGVNAKLPEIEDAIKSNLQSGRGRKKLGNEGPLKQTLRRIMSELSIPSPTLRDIIKSMKDSDLMNDIFHSLIDPSPWLVCTVDMEKKQVIFLTRKNNDEQIRTFSTISTALSEIK